MRVLVTRAETAAQETLRRLARDGHEAVLLPLAAPRHDPEAALEALRQKPDRLAVTSAESLRCLAELGAALAPFLALPVYAVGEATAQAARSLGFRQVQASAGDGAALAADLAALPPAKLIYLAGQPRAETLEAGLKDHGIPFELREIYRMEDIAYPPALLHKRLEGGPIDAVLLYSAETARRFLHLPLDRMDGSVFEKTRFLCISDKVGQALQSLAKDRVFVAREPNETSLLSLL
ncbi:uroporphyrinogen-III synthase [Rhizobium paknamense]|uniref:Uroporphyrinogen-III synthase n=1 Tax=Rhizobium paknamense TaxID=1206817 RepID=A0ABU0IHD9_9HYPH|nr:uroporphyrinogen-III synthase [Rhizobium paknamense]MDQ0456639.1 uroporphyrinogen-III synthase [Rhizobium paknamense]